VDAYWRASTTVLEGLRAELVAHAPTGPARLLRRAS